MKTKGLAFGIKKPAVVRDNTRYRPHHAWYLADAQLFIRELQDAMWPLFHHVALGGGVLNHGYSDKDLDVYVLPNYQEGVDHEALMPQVEAALSYTIGANPQTDMMAQSSPGHRADWMRAGAFTRAFIFVDSKGRQIDVFVVRAMPAGREEPAPQAPSDDEEATGL